MKHASARFAILAAMAGLGMSFSGPPWQKLDTAKVAAANSGLPIAVYATVNSKAESC